LQGAIEMIDSFSGATDLLGDTIAPTKRTNDRHEAAALCEVLKALKAHPAVSWCERMNTGAAKVGNRFIRFGFKGCPDVLGQLRDGRLLGVEVKSPHRKTEARAIVLSGTHPWCWWRGLYVA
jgi:hypothetical protein